MKKIMLLLTAIMLISAHAFGASLTWELPEKGTVDKYLIFYASTEGGQYSLIGETPDLKFDLDGVINTNDLASKTACFVVQGVNDVFGEGQKSDELCEFLGPPSKPINIKFTMTMDATLTITK